MDENAKKSFFLAEELAERESDLEELEKKAKGTTILARIRKRVAKLREQISNDLFALEILPQARAVVAAREKRKDAIIEQTVLGRLDDALCEQGVIEDEDISVGGADVSDPFTGDCDLNAFWQSFMKALGHMDGKDRKMILNSISYLVRSSILDLANTELPPVVGYRLVSKSKMTN